MDSAPLPRFMTLDDVVEELGISRVTAYSLVRTGELPAIQVGPKNVWRIERRFFEEYLDQQHAATRDRIARGDM